MKITATTLLLMCFCAKVWSQKLPNVQQVSLRAPANVKIDGKAVEWGNKLQAYNTATDVSYTIANDNETLYLIIQAADKYNINKIVNGGIKLNIQKNGSKTDAGSPSIQFPYMEKGARVSFLQRLDLTGKSKDEQNQMLDSVMQANNRKLKEKVKYIYVTGIPGVDSVLSIYNDQGIRVAHAFDVEKVYTAEIAISLKKLGLDIADVKKFAYHITINGGANKYSMGISFGPVTNDDGTANEEFSKQLNRLVEINAATTDFWGEYTVTK
ncbi:hypothetical protein [Mucilaginibacter auburnensis]|uniref:Uncharacterized protein n=1 Tax=Mucilaginibacter auburnensis TaxID=1457233 RepID=A0A2H9VU92_9SPHI|nr:hypothetical protein [Mucilaginibacter auburnensis]PJJ84396.1 hypothetical protein CLV57_1407 [Mucilaginibacter auburnensis]